MTSLLLWEQDEKYALGIEACGSISKIEWQHFLCFGISMLVYKYLFRSLSPLLFTITL
jgi:hypothetical protein